MSLNLRAFRFYSSSAAEKIQRLLQPKKITEGLLPKDVANSVSFSLCNGTDHFALPLQRIVFTYCPHRGDSRPLMEYLSKNVIKFAKDHPTVEVVVACKFSAPAKIEAFYNGDFEHRRLCLVGGGREVEAEHVALQVERMRDASGLKPKRFKMQTLSAAPAVRPIYSQFLHPNPKLITTKKPE